MPAPSLETAVRYVPGLAIVDLRGEIDGFAASSLDAAFALAESHDPPAILLNLANVGYINSKGIALIVALLTRARQAHRQLLACGLDPHYQELFAVTRLAQWIALYPDETSALAARPFLSETEKRSSPGVPAAGAERRS